MERKTRRYINERLLAFGLAAAVPLLVPRAVQASGLTKEEGLTKEPKEVLPDSLECPIHYWHEVHSKATFEHYIYTLISSGYQPVTLSDLADYFSKGKVAWPEGTSPMAMTFDDGLLSVYRNAVPVLDSWNIPATFAVMPEWEGDGVHEYMTKTQIKEISGKWEIASHTFNHPCSLPLLKKANPGSWQGEIVLSKRSLEAITGKPVSSFVYPCGAYDEDTVELVSKHYRIAVVTGGKPMLYRSNLFTLPRQSFS